MGNLGNHNFLHVLRLPIRTCALTGRLNNRLSPVPCSSATDRGIVSVIVSVFDGISTIQPDKVGQDPKQASRFSNRKMSSPLWLERISEKLRSQAVAAFEKGDLDGFLAMTDNDFWLALVFHNHEALAERRLYERALVHAFIGTRTNNYAWPRDVLDWMFAIADRERLRAAGDALPGQGPFTVYRGVSGIGAARRVRGISWTASEERAWWFARRFFYENPAVYRTAINDADILAYSNARDEREFLVRLPDGNKPVRLKRFEGSNLRIPELRAR
jgi:hypothetical protein